MSFGPNIEVDRRGAGPGWIERTTLVALESWLAECKELSGEHDQANGTNINRREFFTVAGVWKAKDPRSGLSD